MSIVLITGSSGLVGSESVNFFCKKGFDVIGIDNNLRKIFFGKFAKRFKTKNTGKNNFIDGDFEDIEDNDDKKI